MVRAWAASGLELSHFEGMDIPSFSKISGEFVDMLCATSGPISPLGCDFVLVRSHSYFIGLATGEYTSPNEVICGKANIVGEQVPMAVEEITLEWQSRMLMANRMPTENDAI